MMRDHFEFIDLIAYVFGCGVILPAVRMIGLGNPAATLLVLLLVVPIPFYVARFRVQLPKSIDSFLQRYAYLLFFVGLGFLIASLLAGVIRWSSKSDL